MEEQVKCEFCGHSEGKTAAIQQGWTTRTEKAEIPVGKLKKKVDVVIWTHNKVKVFNQETKQYDYYPRCVAKNIKRGTFPHMIPCGGGEVRITGHMRRMMKREQALQESKKGN